MKKLVFILILFLSLTGCEHIEQQRKYYVDYVPGCGANEFSVPVIRERGTDRIIRILPPNGFYKHVNLD